MTRIEHQTKPATDGTDGHGFNPPLYLDHPCDPWPTVWEKFGQGQLLEEARAAMDERRFDEAREKLNAVLESNASPILKAQVRRQLEQLERRGKKKEP